MGFDLSPMASKLGLDISGYARGMLQATSIASIFPATVTNFMANPLLGVIGIAKDAAAAIFDLARAGLSLGFKLAIDYEQAEVAFGVILGGTDKAKRVLKDLSDFAAATPFELPELISATRSLAAFGVEQEKLLPTLRNIGDVAAGIGAPVNQIAEIFGKARVQGRLFQEDINQLTGRGIPIIQELAKQFGVSDSAVKKMTESGQVNFSHLEKAFEAMSGTGGKFAGLMEKQSGTVGGLFSTLKDSVGTAMRGVAESIIEGFNLKSVLKSIGGMIENLGPMLTEALSGFWVVVKDVAAVLGDILAPIIEGMKPHLAGMWSLFKGVASVIGSVLVPVFKILAPILKIVAEIIGAMLANIGKVLDGAGKIASKVSGFLGFNAGGGTAPASGSAAGSGSGGGGGVAVGTINIESPGLDRESTTRLAEGMRVALQNAGARTRLETDSSFKAALIREGLA